MEISKETFEKMEIPDQIITVYDGMITIEKKLDTMCAAIKRKKFIDCVYSGTGGIIGGFLTVLAKITWWDK